MRIYNQLQVRFCRTHQLMLPNELLCFAGGTIGRCYEWVPMVKCKSNDKMCLNYCLKKDSSYIGGFCSRLFKSCFCSKRSGCAAHHPPGGAAGPVTACDAIGIDDAAWRAVNFGSVAQEYCSRAFFIHSDAHL